MYGPSTLPVTGASTFGLMTIVFGDVSPVLWVVLVAATLISGGIGVVNLTRLHNNENRLWLAGRPVHQPVDASESPDFQLSPATEESHWFKLE